MNKTNANKPTDILVNLASLQPSLAPSEQRVGNVILANPGRAAHLTITELAGLAETSETTVIRFCRSIGAGGYPELRIALATSAAKAGIETSERITPDVAPEDDIAAVVSKVAVAESRAIHDTLSNVDLEQLSTTVEAVAKASRVDIYGVAASGFVALDLQQKLHRIGISAFAWSDPHMALPSAANLSQGDVAIGVSHSGTTIDTIDSLTEARKSGATTVAITNFGASPIIRVSDLVLRTSVSETTFRSGAMASRIAGLALVDCLFVGVAQVRYGVSMDALERTRSSVASRHRSRRR